VAAPSSPLGDTVKDSFIAPSSDAVDDTSAPAKEADRFNDALSEAIKETMALAHLPLDDDDDDGESRPPTPPEEEDEGTDEELEPVSKPSNRFNFVSKASALRDKSLNLNTFQCMDPSNGGYSTRNPNARTIQILEEMCKHYDQMQDQWRTLAYRKGITTLKKQTTKITTAKQAAALPFIGQRLADKIEEIVLTDRLRKLDNTRNDPLDAVLRLFLGIYGAGLVQANKWIQAGYLTLTDLQTKAKLTESHKIGIEHYDDFNSRIPRAEAEAHGAIVKQALAKIDPKFEATIMGSYRRGAKDSSDIDMILTCPGASLSTLHTVVFDSLVPQLFKSNFLKASLATSRSNNSSGTKWHGASCLPNASVWRRMDFLLVPEEEMGAALIYFTGNDIFNRSIRLLARKKGMRLNQRGLYKDVKRGRRGEKLNEGVLVEGRSERKIFEILGVPWREPHERIC
jgi:DNA polymerase IV